LIEVSLTISPVKDARGKTIGASKIARDTTERKRSEAQIINLAHEAEHRTKNILATVQAAVRLSHSNSSDDLKRLIEGRINALAKVHYAVRGIAMDGSPASQSGHARAVALPRRERGACAN